MMLFRPDFLQHHEVFGPHQAANLTPESLTYRLYECSLQRLIELLFCELVLYALGPDAFSVEDFIPYHSEMLPKLVSSYLFRFYPQSLIYHQALNVKFKLFLCLAAC